MAKTGPAATPTAVLERRGSALAPARKKAAREAHLPPPPAPRRGTFKRLTRKQLEKLTRLIPGYDPWETAGDCTFNDAAANDALAFFHEELVHVKGEKAGELFILEPWEQAIIANLFGWKRPDGTRRYREAFIYVPRGNGKTPLAAGLLLYMLIGLPESGAELYGAADKYERAALTFAHARGMVLAHAEWRPDSGHPNECQVFKGQAKSIQMGEHTGFATYRVISGDKTEGHGFNTHAAVIDELHLLDSSDLVDGLETSLGKRREPLLICTTTADFNRDSVCNERYKFACDVRDGLRPDATFLPVIYEAAQDAEWTSPEVWRAANPNYGVTVFEEFLTRQCEKAKRSATKENTFKRLYLNIQTEQDVRWLSMEAWDACPNGIDERALAGEPCWGGLDLATTKDVAAFVLAFERDGVVALVPRFWVPKDNAEGRQRRDKVPYIDWAARGFVELTEGNVVDYNVIRQRINELGDQFAIQTIGIDPWNAQETETRLQEDGFDVVKMRQGFATMSGPSKELERRVLAGTLNHANNPVLRWMASNVSVRMDTNGNLQPAKDKSTEKIDGIVAAIMAIGVMMVAERAGSVYEERGVVML